MLTACCVAVLLGLGAEGAPPAALQLWLPSPVNPPTGRVEMRLNGERATYTVPEGVQVAARFHGELVAPLTDPGRTQVRIDLVTPLLARDGRTVLLPVGTQLLARVHLLRGRYTFNTFLLLVLPDGRTASIPEDTFRLGPGEAVSVSDGSPVSLTVWRSLRVEAFGARP